MWVENGEDRHRQQLVGGHGADTRYALLVMTASKEGSECNV